MSEINLDQYSIHAASPSPHIDYNEGDVSNVGCAGGNTFNNSAEWSIGSPSEFYGSSFIQSDCQPMVTVKCKFCKTKIFRFTPRLIKGFDLDCKCISGQPTEVKLRH